MNLFKSELSFPSGTWPLPYGNRFGLTGKISYHFGNSISLPLSFLKENLSFCYVYDTQKLGDWESEWSSGYECGFFNTFFLQRINKRSVFKLNDRWTTRSDSP